MSEVLMNRPLMIRKCRTHTAAMLTALFTLVPGPATAAMFYSVDAIGHVISGAANFTASGDTLTLTLTNTTPSTRNVTDLLTGIDFSLQGLTPTLISITGVLREVATNGSFSD